MTNADIKKALECCIIGDCQGCVYGETDQRHCREDLMQIALDLINRQQADIERLKYNLEAVLNERADHSEAIKEFAERLKEQMKYLTRWQAGKHTYYVVGTEIINNLVKEMVGE